MAPFVFFIFLFFSSASAACFNCTKHSKAAYFAQSSGLISGACGYGPLALKFYGGHVAAAGDTLFKSGEGCGGCFQIRCKNSNLCNKKGATIVLTDLHSDKAYTTDFVLSIKAFRAMALPGKDKQLVQLGIADVEYTRTPCVYKRQNLALQVEKFSHYPNHLAIKILYQGGLTTIVGVEVASVDNPSWISMSRNYGAVWDTNKAPNGKLMFRFIIYSGYDAQHFYVNEVLPANWTPGVIYNSTVQIDNISLVDTCPDPCPWV
ncbi:expansin-like A3 [Beta vulgaris subsp. vulgaris]|uniref:expansin-like A3 n=1 Tax=Beta vulgaris subsp. vulgaris TaxID=3555 RepID=UPI002037514A|nr:expansin-like A3 [Beta vulgaris subsp. vulgaris]